MKVDTVVTLANNKEYLLLLESKLVGEDYFLAVKTVKSMLKK